MTKAGLYIYLATIFLALTVLLLIFPLSNNMKFKYGLPIISLGLEILFIYLAVEASKTSSYKAQLKKEKYKYSTTNPVYYH